MANWTRRDSMTAAALALASAAIRIPFRSTQIFRGDSYGLAMGALFTWTAHPPGFIGYCALVRLANYLIGDVNVSFVAVNIAVTGVATALTFAIGRFIFGRSEALIAALFFATSIDASYFSEVALTYAAEGACAAAAGLTAWLAVERRSGPWLIAHSAVLAAGGSVRQTTLTFLFPLWLFTMWRASRSWRARVVAALALVLIVFAWSIPNANNLRRYWEQRDVSYFRSVYDLQVRMSQYYDSSTFGRVEYEPSVKRFHWPLVELAVAAWNAVVPPSPTAPPEVLRASAAGAARMIWYQTLKLAGYLLLACGLWTAFLAAAWRGLGRERLFFFVLWIAPATLFFALNHFGSWGYLLILLPALAVLAARGIIVWFPRHAVVVAAVISAIHFASFVTMRPLPETSDRAKLINTALLQYDAPAIRMSYGRARSSIFTADPRELHLDCVTDACLRRSIPQDFHLPPDVRPMQPLFH